MKATIDIPDAMYRQVKAHAALQGRAVREVTIELYQRWLAEIGATSEAHADARAPTADRGGRYLAGPLGCDRRGGGDEDGGPPTGKRDRDR